MRKIFITALGFVLSCVSSQLVMAQSGLNTSYNASFTVRNISQNNVDATKQVVKPGDILMYQVQLTGITPVSEEVIRVRTGAIEGTMTLVDSTDGRIEGSYLYFPTVTDAKNSWNRTFAFYMRVESQPVKSTVAMNFGAQTTTINIGGGVVSPRTENNTTPTTVPKTGANYNNSFLLFGGILGLLVILRFKRRIKS